MSLISIYVEATVTCPRCQNPIHLNGAAESVLCDRCQNPMEMTPEMWAGLLTDEIGEAAGMEEGTGQESSQWGGLNAKLKYGRLAARCAKCKNPFPHLDPKSLSGQIFCPSCGNRTSARQAPAWIKKLHPAITAIVGETLAGDQAARLEGIQPIVIHCFSCGGQLSCDGSTRNPACNFCGSENFLPDQLWLRLHPAAVREAWFLLLDLAGAVGLLPSECQDCVGIAYAATGNSILAYIDYNDNSHIDALDANGNVAWRSAAIQFSDEAALATSPGGQYVVIADEDKNFLQYIDPASGQPLWRIEGAKVDYDSDLPPAAPRPFELDTFRGVAVDADGSIVILQYGDDESDPLLTRYSGDGSFQPMWNGQYRYKKSWDQPDWDELADGMIVPPDDVEIAIGNDGNFYIVDETLTHVASFDRTGRMLQNRELQSRGIDEIHAFGVDSAGTIYALVEGDGSGRDTWSHVFRIFAGGQPELIAGPGLTGSGPVGEYDDKIAVAPNGNLYIAYELESVRILDGYGRLIWRSHATEKHDNDAD